MSGFDWADERLEFQTAPAREDVETADEKPQERKPNPYIFAAFE